MFPANLVDMNPKDVELARLNADPNFFSVNDGRRCTLGKAVPKDELKHIGHTLLNRTIDDTGHGYVEWNSDRDYFTVEDGAGRKYESRDFAFAANFLFSGQELLAAGKTVKSRMDKLRKKSLKDLYRETESSVYERGHATLGDGVNRKGSAGFKNAKYVALGIAALVVLGAGAYLLGGSQPGVTPATTYPDFNSKDPIPAALAVRDSATITPLDPVKDLGAGKYRIGDTIIDTTDNKADIAVAYGGVEKVIKNGDKQIKLDVYLYADKKSLDDRKCSTRGMLILQNKPPVYDRWVGCDSMGIKFVQSPEGFTEIKLGLFYQKTLAGIGGTVPTGIEFKTNDKSASLIVPQNELIKYFKCNDNGERCQY